MYRLACTGLAVTPAECLYVGDGGSGELTGAAAVGMRPVLLADDDWATATASTRTTGRAPRSTACRTYRP